MCTIINLYGGPCSGKSTLAAYLFYRMKVDGYKVELAWEYAKDLVYDERMNILNTDQLYIFAKQNRKIFRLLNKVDFILTDSPIFLSIIYNSMIQNKQSKEFEQFVIAKYREYNNVNIVLDRNFSFQDYGRVHNTEDRNSINYKIIEKLDEYSIPYERITSGVTDSQIYSMLKFKLKDFDKNPIVFHHTLYKKLWDFIIANEFSHEIEIYDAVENSNIFNSEEKELLSSNFNLACDYAYEATFRYNDIEDSLLIDCEYCPLAFTPNEEEQCLGGLYLKWENALLDHDSDAINLAVEIRDMPVKEGIITD